MSAIEQELLEQIHKLNTAQKKHLLDYIQQLTTSGDIPGFSLRDLSKLPPDERDRRIAESFALAADEDFELFEAYSDDDFDDYD